jgi:hypothetical protein
VRDADEAFRIFGQFLAGMFCVYLGIALEWAGQFAYYFGSCWHTAGTWLMTKAEKVQEYGFRVGVWD